MRETQSKALITLIKHRPPIGLLGATVHHAHFQIFVIIATSHCS